MTKTFSQKPADVNRTWHLIDATGIPLGRIATISAELLNGSNKVTFSPHVDGGDFVVVINADKMRVTGKKDIQKIYYRHSGYIGSMKETSLKTLMAKDSTKVIEKAVYGMLPKNKLRSGRMQRLKLYSGSEHDHAPQNPAEVKNIMPKTKAKKPKTAPKKEDK